MEFYDSSRHGQLSIFMNSILSILDSLSYTRESLMKTLFHNFPSKRYLETFLSITRRYD